MNTILEAKGWRREKFLDFLKYRVEVDEMRHENEFCRLAGYGPLTRRFSRCTRGRWRTMRVSRSRTSRAGVPGPRAEARSAWQEVAKPRRKWWTARGGSTFASWRNRTETVTCVRLTPAPWYPNWGVWTFLVSHRMPRVYFLSDDRYLSQIFSFVLRI